VLVLVGVLLFGRGRISDLMGDVAKGIKSFKKGLSDDDTDHTQKPPTPQHIQSPNNMTDITPVSVNDKNSKS
jgi:sec-independent protein translocase protein TatA